MKCRKCGYQWEPNPEKWRSMPTDQTKLLKCPVCFNWNELQLTEDVVALVQKKSNPAEPKETSEKPSGGKPSSFGQQKPSEDQEPTPKENSKGSKQKTPDTGEATAAWRRYVKKQLRR